MPVANPQKTISAASMQYGDTATVTLSFDSAASLALKPADIVLIMDRSSSMTQERMLFAKAAAKHFIDTVNGARSGATRMGLVSFSAEATEDVALTDSFADLKPAVDAMTAGSYANHKAAFEAAGRLLRTTSSARQVVVMFTDSEPSTGNPAAPAVQALKDMGAEIFCLGLGCGPAVLKLWASEPDSIHVACTDKPAQLDQLFQEIAAEVVLAGALDVVIQEQLMPDFKIVRLHAPAAGAARITGPQSLIWTMDAVGIREQPTTVSLSFDIMYVGNKTGVLPVNQQVIYTDREENTLEFPCPTVEAGDSGAVVYPEKCPEPTVFQVGGCLDAAHITLADTYLQSLGRIVQLDVTLKAVCPGKRVAVSIILTEISPEGTQLPRGVKHILVPAQAGEACQDILLKCIRFSLPEALDASGNIHSICNPRQFNAQVIANYVDTDYICCDADAVIL